MVLGGLAGHDLDRATVAAAVEAEAAITAALHGLDADGRISLATELRAVEPTDPPAGPRSYQQLREAWLRQREEIRRLAALTKWTEELLDLAGAGAAPGRSDDRPAQRVASATGSAGSPSRRPGWPSGAPGRPSAGPTRHWPRSRRSSSDRPRHHAPRIVGIVQARMGSSRLPGKVLRPLAGRSVLGRVVRAARESGVLDRPGGRDQHRAGRRRGGGRVRAAGRAVPPGAGRRRAGPVRRRAGRRTRATRSCGSPPTARCSTRRSSRWARRSSGPCRAGLR